jgi:release factor glutamine methyltransferase
VLEALQRATQFLERKSIASARLESEVLLSFVLGRSRVALYTGFDQPLTSEELDRYRDVLRRRACGEPTAYLVGEKEFWSLKLAVDARVLIPRPDTERLVEAALEVARALAENAPRVVDLGTGSGAIAIAIAGEIPSARVVATDVSPDALAVARLNIERHGLADRVRLLEGDLYGALEPSDRFDLIVSNPPYVRRADVASLQPEIVYHEPRGALDGGDDGLDIIRRVIAGAPRHLESDGALLCEIGMDQGASVRALAEGAGLTRIEILRDLGGNERTLRARLAPSTHG